MLERLPYRVMVLHGGVIAGGDIYIRTTFNRAPLTSHDTTWERTIACRCVLHVPPKPALCGTTKKETEDISGPASPS
eukprot:SAG25_NODE_13061_length_271_cov_10.110465_1_plen_76_part_10